MGNAVSSTMTSFKRAFDILFGNRDMRVVMQFLMSCLFANTNIAEFLMNGSFIMELNSSLARLIRSRSSESTTKINPSVLLK